jgi:hypothetical protein
MDPATRRQSPTGRAADTAAFNLREAVEDLTAGTTTRTDVRHGTLTRVGTLLHDAGLPEEARHTRVLHAAVAGGLGSVDLSRSLLAFAEQLDHVA